MSDYEQIFKHVDGSQATVRVTGDVCTADNIAIGPVSKVCCGGECGGECEGKVGHSPSAREQLLKDAIGIVTKDRNNVYGPPEDSFQVVAAYWNTYLKHSKVATVDAADVAIMMALMKMARLTFNKRHRDSAVDAAGYLACLQEALND